MFVKATATKKTPIDLSCRGFFADPRHLSSHFEYETNSPPLEQNIRENLKTFIGIFM